MKVVNTKTGKDITRFYIDYMYGNITKEEFERLTELKK